MRMPASGPDATPDETRLHVVFGTGPVGLAITDELTRTGRRVRVVSRSGRAAVGTGVEVMAGDVTDRAFARTASAGASVVYFALNPPYHRWPELFPALQESVLDGAAAAGAKLVAMENVYMYGPTGGRPLTEDVPASPTTRKGRVRAEMTERLFAAHRAGTVRATAGRASDVFGPRVIDSAAGSTVFGRAIAGKPAQVAGDPDLPHTYSYAPDIGRALVTLGDRDDALGRAWHLPGPETVSTRRFAELVFAAAARPPKVQAAPSIVFRAMGLFNPAMREMVEMLYEFREPFILDSSAFTGTFGGSVTPLEQAIRETIAWYRRDPAARG